MSAGADGDLYWLTQCSACWATFRDSPQQAAVCPHCGHEND